MITRESRIDGSKGWSRKIALAMVAAWLGVLNLGATPVLTLTEPESAIQSPYVFGYSFQVGSQPLLANALGYYYDGTAYQYAHPVGLWDEAGTLLGSVSVPSGTPGGVVANYAYVNLVSPVFLAADGIYTVGALNPIGSDYVPWHGEIATIPGITIQSWLYAAAIALQEPDTWTDFAVPAANIDASAVPEPATWGMLALGLLAAGLGARRRAATR